MFSAQLLVLVNCIIIVFSSTIKCCLTWEGCFDTLYCLPLHHIAYFCVGVFLCTRLWMPLNFFIFFCAAAAHLVSVFVLWHMRAVRFASLFYFLLGCLVTPGLTAGSSVGMEDPKVQLRLKEMELEMRRLALKEKEHDYKLLSEQLEAGKTNLSERTWIAVSL